MPLSKYIDHDIAIMKEFTMRKMINVLAGIALLGLGAGAAFADELIGNMKLLPGYEHIPEQGVDSIVGRIANPDGLQINYEIGNVTAPGEPRTGGSFTDRPGKSPADENRWYDEKEVGGMEVHFAYRNDDWLLVSFPERGMNLSVLVRDQEEMAEALSMILTYP